jgi:hypothetical protein
MNRVFWISAAVVVLLLTAAVWLSANATFLYRHPRAKDVRIVMDYRSGSAVVAPTTATATAKPAPRAGAAPRVVAPETVHDFGIMNPLTMGRHAFVIRNEGTAPLKLQVGPTTCKCTVSGLASREVQPGGHTTVSMDWNTGRDRRYAHAATIYTNDPSRKALYFTVQGEVRMLLGAEPKELSLPAADPDSRSTAEVLIYSQLWSDFEIEQVRAALPEFTWRVENIAPDQASDLAALGVKRLHCEFNRPPQGRFAESLDIEIREQGGESRRETLSIPIAGSVKRRLAFYGSAIDADGTIDLGNIDEGQSREVKLIAKIRDEEKSLENVKLSVFPDFATARWQPHPDGAEGMYQLTIEIPAGTPPCQYKSNPLGRLRIDTDHPRIGDVELNLSFAIVPRS